ncbi:L,D-transpeptidase family protein [Alterisphingorhabdus coralli]|uniref:L,D-transpeptidase family protein n=1 Tax=Alterisphingorhabdus coralli TaxID=3071408 RepID=A0AA97HZR7_9SPHN|nr:L,D-transpeptidase family protein [Parasphingorhabdus sp. SCSIO 66989]WOE75019.1 L,D-transpeptidase family protein [Parasphingorhabdus sp. SCSIO 66989]
MALLALTGCQTAASESEIIGGAEAVAKGLTADAILVDKSDRTLDLYADGKVIARYTGIQLGDDPVGHKRFQGDERTPEGRYTIDRRNPNSIAHLSLGISYPNAEDRAYAEEHGLSPGGDIFIHGQLNGWPDNPAVSAIPYDWTDGCIAVSNGEMDEIWQLVPVGTEIIIRP